MNSSTYPWLKRIVPFCIVSIIFLSANQAIANAIFTITPTTQTIHLPLDTERSQPVSFDVVSAEKIPNITFDTALTPNLFLGATIVPGPHACIAGSTLEKGETCQLYIKVKSHATLGAPKLVLRVCGYGGFVCSKGATTVEIEKPSPTNVTIVGSVNPTLPSKMKQGDSEKLTFTFKNENIFFPATHVQVNTSGLSTLSHLINGCTSKTLPAGGKCTITGDFDANTLGHFTPTATLTYHENTTPVVISTSTTVEATKPPHFTFFQGKINVNYVEISSSSRVEIKLTNTGDRDIQSFSLEDGGGHPDINFSGTCFDKSLTVLPKRGSCSIVLTSRHINRRGSFYLTAHGSNANNDGYQLEIVARSAA